MSGQSDYRRQLIDAGALTVSKAHDIARALGLPVLLLDEAGAAAARRHIQQGECGGKIMSMPAGLALWQEEALAARERRRST